MHFGRKPNTEWSQAFHNIVNSDTSAQSLERNLLTPDQIASQDYSRDRAKVVPRGSLSPQIFPRFNPMFSLEGNIADSAPYKALADLARAANNWSQQKRNLPPDGGKRVLQELSSRHSDLGQSLKTGLSRKTLFFAEDRPINTPPEAQDTVRRLPTLQPRRQSKTSKLETLLLSDPTRVRVFRKIIDRQSGKPLFKLAKFKIIRVTDHTYVTDKGKVYRKNHFCLKPNYNNISATHNTLGDRLQTSSSKSGGKKPFTRASNQSCLKNGQLTRARHTRRWWTLLRIHQVRALPFSTLCRKLGHLLRWKSDYGYTTNHHRLRLAARPTHRAHLLWILVSTPRSPFSRLSPQLGLLVRIQYHLTWLSPRVLLSEEKAPRQTHIRRSLLFLNQLNRLRTIWKALGPHLETKRPQDFSATHYDTQSNRWKKPNH